MAKQFEKVFPFKNCININYKTIKILKSISTSRRVCLVFNYIFLFHLSLLLSRIRFVLQKYVVAYLYARCKNIFAFQIPVVATAPAVAWCGRVGMVLQVVGCV